MATGIGGMDPGALQRKALDAAEQAGRDAGTAGVGQPEPGGSDAARFQEAMNPADARGADAPARDSATAGPPRDPQTVQTAGDRILEGMGSISEKIRAGRDEAVAAMAKENVSQADLLRANFSMLQSSTLVSAVSKTTEKITQSLKTLQQG